MKKITLAFFMSLLSFTGFAQLAHEGFEDPWTPSGPVNWLVHQNSVGTIETWRQSNPLNDEPAHGGTYAAFVNNQNVPNGNVAQDWLVTPSFTMPDTPQLRFWSRLAFNGNQGGIYKVLLYTSGDLADINSYTVITTWTEPEINPTQQQYREVIVDLPDTMEGQNVRIAFLMEADNADKWYVDDVMVVEKCLIPTGLAADNIGTDGANLTWDAGAATQWEIEVIAANLAPTGTGIVVDDPEYVPVLNPDTDYKFYVRALCGVGNSSDWSEPLNFSTVGFGDNCSVPLVIDELPYSTSDSTNNFANEYSGNPGSGCGTSSPWIQYLGGYDAVYSYTATFTGEISINLANITDDYASMFVYTSCNDIGVNCYAGIVNDFMQLTDLDITHMAVTAGTTYYIVVSSATYSPIIGYMLNIQQENCDKPTDLSSSDATASGITLNWVEAGAATSWEYVYHAVGTGLPSGAGTSVNDPSVTLSGLPDSTQYEFYVRANCGDGTYSSWAGPVNFNTLCEAFSTPYTEGFNSNSTSEFCWTVANINGAESLWDMNYADAVFEGNQAARLDVGMNGADNNDMLISPPIQLTGNQRLKFHYATDDMGAVAFKVVLSTTGTAPEDFTTELLPLTSYANTAFVQKTISLTSIPAGTVYIAWQVPEGVNPGYQLIVDNVIIENMPVCAEPTDVIVSNVTSSSATIAWTPGNNEASWEILVGAPSDIGTPTAGTPGLPASNPYTAALQPNSPYVVYVRSACGGNGNSPWVGPLYFNSACTAFPVPFFEGFNSDSDSQNCWITKNNNGDWAEWSMDSAPGFEGDEAASLYAGNMPNNDWIISPAITLNGNQRLKYHYRVDGGTAGFEVLLSSAQRDVADFTQILLPDAAYTNSDYKKQVVSLEGYTGTVYLAWHVPPTAGYDTEIFIDNIIVEDIPVCPEPLDVTIGTVTQNSAEISWTAGGDETQWEVFVYEEGQDFPAEGVVVSSTNYTVTALANGNPLAAGVTYHVGIKAVCSDTESSVSSDDVTFITVISNDECENTIVVPVNNGPECEVFAWGSLNDATLSPQPSTCGDWVPLNSDVWFEFTATSARHTLSIIDVTPVTQGLLVHIYEDGDCGNLTEYAGCMTSAWEYGLSSSTQLLENLTIGAKYKVRIGSSEIPNGNVTFKVCIKTPVNPISVSTTQYTVEQLVTNVLFDGNCTQVSNVSWSTGTNYPDPDNVFGDNPNGIAYFNQNNSSFPFEEGIVLATGDVTQVPGPAYRYVRPGSALWLGDNDVDQVLETFFNVPDLEWPMANASVIEFDFVPSTPEFSLDFLFASNEYGDFIQCFTWDTFVVLLTDSDGNTQNIAKVPGTEQPISVFTISGDGYPGFCPGYNLEWWDHYNVFEQNDFSPISFAGQTKVMTASAELVPNQQYHLKIAIADSDRNLSSGVFIKAGIQDGVEDIDLGEDRLIATATALCEGDETTLVSGLNPDNYTFEWIRNEETIEGETAADLVVNQPGTYTVNASLNGTTCVVTDTIVVEYYPAVEDVTNTPQDIMLCGNAASFNLTQNNAVILAGLIEANYSITYHVSLENATDNVLALASPYTAVSNPQTIYARVTDLVTGCHGIHSFEISSSEELQFNLTGNTSVCIAENAVLEVTNANFNIDNTIYAWTLNGEAITADESKIYGEGFGKYEVTVTTPDGCSAVQSITVIQNNAAFDIAITHGCAADNVYYINVAPVNGSYNAETAAISWTGPDGFASSEASAAIDKEGIYTVKVITDEGCETSQSITVNSAACLIPRGISPNGDTLNDTFDLSGFAVTKLSIYNRYGRQVYSFSGNYTNEWHGQEDNGNDLPTGTYFYSIESSNTNTKTGWVYINREE